MEFNYLPANLPVRVWHALKDQLDGDDYNVSALLCACWASFVVPVERLDFLGDNHGHPSGDADSDNENIKLLVNCWNKYKEEKIVATEDSIAIYAGEKSESPAPGSRDWFGWVKGLKQADKIDHDQIVCIIRHGLSHGNIWALDDQEDPLQENADEQIEWIWIANYPPNKSEVKVLRIRIKELRSLVGSFIDWYKKFPDAQREELAKIVVTSN